MGRKERNGFQNWSLHAPCSEAPLLTVMVMMRLMGCVACEGGGGVKDAESSREHTLQGRERGDRRVRATGAG